MPNDVTRDEIVAEARSWLGVPWEHQGRTRQGVDCAGLVIVVANSLRLSSYDTTDYQRRTQGHRFLHHFRSQMQQIAPDKVKPGDVLLFRDSAFPCHSSVVGERNGKLTIIHAHAPRRKVVEELLEQGDWMSRIVGCFRFHGIGG